MRLRNRHLALSALVCLGLTAPVLIAAPIAVTPWGSGLTELNQTWLEHDGDRAEWSRPGFDDSSWDFVDLENQGPGIEGSRWYRHRVSFGSDQRDLRLLIVGGDGTYELFVNGNRVSGPTLLPSLLVRRTVETVFPIHSSDGIFEIALRTRIPQGYSAWHLPQFTNVTAGLPAAVEYERQALEGQRLYGLGPSLVINLLLCLAGVSSLAVFIAQRKKREYVFLGLYLLLVGVSNGLSTVQSSGLVPLSAIVLVADPLIYSWVFVQVDCTYSFAARGPVGLVLSFLFCVWYFWGNREAGWLVLPRLAPAVATALFDLGTASIKLGWQPFNFLVDAIRIGPIGVQMADVGSLVFLLSIAVVMSFRFSRGSREQAGTAAELAPARKSQRHLVPAVLPSHPSYAIEAAYLPAHEVGGDFYQVLPQSDGSIMVVIGDVSGKGLKAAMTGAFAIGALRALAAEIPDPPALLSRLNREILRGQDRGFVTCLCLKLYCDGQIISSNAVHLSPYRNSEELVCEGGPPLGYSRIWCIRHRASRSTTVTS